MQALRAAAFAIGVIGQDAFLPKVALGAPGHNVTVDGLDAYIYLYPLVLMSETAPPEPLQNRLVNKETFVDPGPGPVVSPNVDTLYTQAFLSLDSTSMELLQIPDADDRYYVMQYLDAWTNTFAGPGKRLNGTDAKTIALVGPDFRGQVPSGTSVLRAPTDLVWLLGRIQVNGVDDLAAVNALQESITLSREVARPEGHGQIESAPTLPPPARVAAMDARTFFEASARLLKRFAPPPEDARIVERLASIGLVPGEDFDWLRLPAATRTALEAVPKAAIAMIGRAGSKGKTRNGWHVPNPATGGPYGTDYFTRAVVAMAGLGANQAAEAVYIVSTEDADGVPYDGSFQYTLTFPSNMLPPVKAFWSLTLYDEDHYLVPNDANRYAIGDRDELVFESDGSLVLSIGATKAGSNWLPAPAGKPFQLMLRCYWPVGGLLDGTWSAPGVRHQGVALLL